MKITLLLALFVLQLGFSQQKTCGTELYMQRMVSDPIAKQKHLDLQERFKIELSKLQNEHGSLSRNTTTTIFIPVAVHFPNVASNSLDKNCLRQLAQNQINTLNADFNATNADIALWTTATQAFYPGTSLGNLNVQFVLATKNHPVGTGLTNGQVAVTFGTDFLAGADNDSTWLGYMNVVVRVAGALGYSVVGGSPEDGGTVVINYDCFGSGTGCAGYTPSGDYNLGRTLAHELGHFFNLKHTFGDSNCNASSTDNCADTPQCLASGGCPTVGSVAGCVANEKALTMNYMDYTDDACMFMFTSNQETRMRAYYNSIASQFATNVLSNKDFEFKDFVLYPNPSKGSFKISFTPKTNDNIEIIVFDNCGRDILNKTFQNSGIFNQELQLNTISSGVYFVDIKYGDNKMIKRIIVE